MRCAQLLCLIWYLLEVHFQTGNTPAENLAWDFHDYFTECVGDIPRPVKTQLSI